MILTGIADEAGIELDAQIKATHELGWKYIEMRAVEVPGFTKGNFHDIPDKAFDIAARQLEEAGLKRELFWLRHRQLVQKIHRPVSNHPR